MGPSRLPTRRVAKYESYCAMSNPSPCLEPVQAVRPAAPYIGGKRMLAQRLVALINETPHTAYAEAFVGMGGVFFRRDRRPKAEIINDWSDDVSNLFRILQHHYVAFMDMLRFQLTTRSNFERLLALEPASLTDLQRAARFIYVQKTAFGGKVASRHFGVNLGTGARFDVTKLGPVLEAIHERLSGVVVERKPWREFVERYDRPGVLFYLDPPYFGNEGDYGAGLFSRDQFAEMAEVLAGLKGRFILSINDRPEVREIFAAFDQRAEDVTWSMAHASKGAARKFGELIITG